MAMAVNGRGAFLPYFGKQSVKWVYSPLELKRRISRGFPVLTQIAEEEKEPLQGLFNIRAQPPPYIGCIR